MTSRWIRAHKTFDLGHGHKKSQYKYRPSRIFRIFRKWISNKPINDISKQSLCSYILETVLISF